MPKEKKSARQNKAKSRTEKRSITFRRSEQFLEDYSNLSQNQLEDVDSTLKLLGKHGDFTPGMRPKKLPGQKDKWYIRVGKDTRITFQYLPGNILFLRRVGGHQVLKHP